MRFDELFATVEADVRCGRLATSVMKLTKMAEHGSTPPAVRVKVQYESGVLFYKHIGNGEKGRLHFCKAVDLGNAMANSGDVRIRDLVIRASENLLLLSLSFDEFEDVGRRVREMQPKSEAISLIGGVGEMRMNGAGWADVMGFLAGYAHEQRDHVLVASIFQLMVSQRRELRLSRNQWRDAVRSYAEAARHNLAGHGDRIARERQAEPSEILFLFDDVRVIVNEYLRENSSDETVMEIRKDIEEMARWLSSAA